MAYQATIGPRWHVALAAILSSAIAVGWAQAQPPEPQSPLQPPSQQGTPTPDRSAAITLGAILAPAANVVTSAFGTAVFVYDPATRELRWRIEHAVFSGGAAGTAAYFHGPLGADTEPDGTSPSVLAIAAGGTWANPLPNPLIGAHTFADTPEDHARVAQLLAGQWYVNIRTTRLPEGEIRGRVTTAVVLRADLTSGSATSTGGGGKAFLLLDPIAGLLRWQINFWELSVAPVTAHLHHQDQRGGDTGIVFAAADPYYPRPDLTLPPPLPPPLISPLRGATSVALTSAQIVQLLAGEWFLDIHSRNFPTGEVRGALLVVDVPGIFVAVRSSPEMHL